nr:hypothetical protein [uncultured Trichococcus sp.]
MNERMRKNNKYSLATSDAMSLGCILCSCRLNANWRKPNSRRKPNLFAERQMKSAEQSTPPASVG